MAVNSLSNQDLAIKKQKLDQVNNEISANEAAISQNKTEVSINETSVNTNNSAQQATSANITDVKEQITTLQSNKSGVQAEMNSVRDALNGASKDDANYAQLNQQMDSLQMSLSDLETMEKDLNNQKTKHEDKLSNQQKEGKALAQNGEKLNKEGKTLNAKKADLEKQKKTAEADKKQAEKASVTPSRSSVGDSVLNTSGIISKEVAPTIVEDIVDNKNVVKKVASAMGANLKTASNVAKGVGKVAGNAGSVIDAGTAIYDYSQGTISGGKALMKTGFAAADVAVNAVPYVGTAISFIGTENIASSAYDEVQAQTNEMQQAINNKDVATIAKNAIDVVTGTTSTKILVGAVLKKVDSTGGIMGIENTYESYRNGTLLKVVAGRAKDVVQSAYNNACEFFGISEPEKKVRNVKKGSKNVVRQPIKSQTKAKAKVKLTPEMNKVFSSIDNQAKQNLQFLLRKYK